MAMAEAIRQSEALPSIKPPMNFPGLEIIKKENSVHIPRLPVSAALNMPAPPLVSPSNMYSGPPPPYSYPPSTASSVVGHGGYISPTEPRKTADDDKEPPSSHRHSLPSIHEALASEPPLSITSLLQKPTPLQIPAPNQTQSPTTLIPRSYPETPRGHPNLLTQPSPTGYSREPLEKPVRPHYSPRASNESVSSRLPGANPHDTHYSTIQPSRTMASPTNSMRPTAHAIQPQHASPIYERTPRPPPPPPQMNSHYTYNSYPAPYSYPPPSSGIAAYPALQHPSWRPAGGAEIDRAEEVRRAASKGSPRASQYGESVKRHLDIFDLETSLNEVGVHENINFQFTSNRGQIAEGSRLASDFARKHGILAHQNARVGIPTETLPNTDECEEMIRRQRGVLDSMIRIKDVINARQEADLKYRQSQEQRYNAPSDYDDDAPGYHDKLDGAGGFVGADAKKRRGRAAPPGRCHSCNRAETPEWRRGPDGARTLCNACGLHYAKLTRKMGSKVSSNSSNLRPKEMSVGSPQ